MERQLANLTGLVQQALTQTLPSASPTDPHSSSQSGRLLMWYFILFSFFFF